MDLEKPGAERVFHSLYGSNVSLACKAKACSGRKCQGSGHTLCIVGGGESRVELHIHKSYKKALFKELCQTSFGLLPDTPSSLLPGGSRALESIDGFKVDAFDVSKGWAAMMGRNTRNIYFEMSPDDDIFRCRGGVEHPSQRFFSWQPKCFAVHSRYLGLPVTRREGSACCQQAKLHVYDALLEHWHASRRQRSTIYYVPCKSLSLYHTPFETCSLPDQSEP